MTGYALATALAAPVEEGMMLAEAARPARQSAPFIEPSTVSCEAVAAWTVVMRPCLMPNFSLMVLTRGARPLVVHDVHRLGVVVVRVHANDEGRRVGVLGGGRDDDL